MAQMRCYANEQLLKGIASEKEDIEQLKTDVADINTTIDTMDSRIDGIDSTLTTMQGDIDNVETAITDINGILDDFISYIEVKVIGSGAGASVSVNAETGVWVDMKPYIDAQMPTGYKMLNPCMIVTSFLNTWRCMVIFVATDSKARINNITTVNDTIQEFRVVVPIVKIVE